MEYYIQTNSLQETTDFAKSLAEKLRGGEVLQLVGDVGAGKTTFVRGMVTALGSNDPVSSPTFTICNTYRAKFLIHHCDFYRLHDDTLIENELAELLDEDSVVILEWAEHVRIIDGVEHITIKLEVINDEARRFSVYLPPKYGYLTV